MVVLAGSNLTVSVNTAGLPAPNYQWQFDGTNLDGQVFSSLTLSEMTPAQSGDYDVVVSNAYGSVTSTVARITVMTPTVYWTGAGDGQSWDDSTNWSTGMLPTSTDSIFIGNTNGTITVCSGLTLSNLLCQCSLTLNGSLNVSGAVDIAQNLSVPSGDSISANNMNAILIGEGATNINGVSIYVGSDGLISFPGLSNFNGAVGNILTSIEAGPGARLDLSSVRDIVGPYPEGALTVTVDAGAVINLSGVTNITGNNELNFDADSTNSVINLSSLLVFTQAGNMQAENGGVILATNLNFISGVSLYVDGSSTLALTGLTEIDGAVGNMQTSVAAGPGAQLDLSSVRDMVGPYPEGALTVTVDAGAVINLSGVTNITGNNELNFDADSTNSVINLSSLLVFTQAGNMQAENGGVILATNLNFISGVSLYVDGSSTLALTGLTEIDGAVGNMQTSVAAGPGAQLDLSSVRDMVGPYPEGALTVTVDAGAVINLSGVTNITGNNELNFDADSTNSVINLSSLLVFTQAGNMQAENGGVILATNLNFISGVSLYVDGSSTLALTGLTEIDGAVGNMQTSVAAGPGAQLDLSSVRDMVGPYPEGALTVTVDAGAVINLSGVTNITGNNELNFDADSTNSVINLLGLQVFTGAGVMSQENGGLILLNTNSIYSDVSLQLAPTITSVPQSTFTIGSGLTVTYSIAVSASSPVYYQWCSNSIPIAGGTGGTLVINNVQPSWSGCGYSVMVSNAYGTATSPVAILTIPTETIRTTVTGNGSIQISPATDNYYLGQTITLTAVPGNYSAFAGWSDGNLNNPRIVVVNTSNFYGVVFTNAYPPVNIVQVGGQAVVLYPMSGSNCTLMTTTNLATGPSVPATNGVSVMAVTFTNTGQAAYFMLQCQ